MWSGRLLDTVLVYAKPCGAVNLSWEGSAAADFIADAVRPMAIQTASAGVAWVCEWWQIETGRWAGHSVLGGTLRIMDIPVASLG